MPLDQFRLSFLIAILSTLITLVVSFRTQLYRSAPGVKPFTAMMLSLGLWTSAVAFGMIASNEGTATIWIMVRMIGVILCPYFWFLFALQFTNREKWHKPRILIALGIVPILSILLLLTNHLHHLFIQDYGFTQYGNYLIDQRWVLGPYFWFHFAYSYFLTLTGDFFILQEAAKLSHTYRRQALALTLAAIFPLITNVTYSFHLLPGLVVNYDPLGLVIAGILLGWALFFNKLFDLTPIARRILVENMIDGMVVLNENNRIVDLNPAAQKIFNLKIDAIGTNFYDSIPEEFLLDEEQKGGDAETYLYQPKGANSSYSVQISPIYWKGRNLGNLITIRNITDQKRIESQLHQLAITDSLTGLTNHRHFYELLRLEINRARRLRHQLSAILFDIDHFKQVNDQNGHLVGDQILRELAQNCKQELRPYDIFARYGGEEFIILMPETNLTDAYVIAERLRKKVESHLFITNSGALQITISLGISWLDLDAEAMTFEDLIERADTAMYAAKKSGRNKTTIWQASATKI